MNRLKANVDDFDMDSILNVEDLGLFFKLHSKMTYEGHEPKLIKC